MSQLFRLLVLILAASSAQAGDVRTSEQRLEDGSRVLRQEVVVNAPIEDVWAAFTTSAGWESWAVPFAHVDLRVGGIIETSYHADAKQGDTGNIHNRILSFLPYRMLSIQAVQAPPGFAYADLLASLHSVIEFETVDGSHTRVTISGVGYREGEGYDALLGFFREGNAWTFERLKKRFDEGPLEWGTDPPEESPASPATSNNNRS
jgi:uncharacterized protein YndB with AHSA1/START domain